MTLDKLIEKAIAASKLAYAPYSKFCVGAAVLTKQGKIIQGCNVENASYGLANCAERTALFSAVAQGYKEFKTLVIYVDREQFTFPCGACRQVIAELAPDIDIILVNNQKKLYRTTIKDLLPFSFDASDLAE